VHVHACVRRCMYMRACASTALFFQHLRGTGRFRL